jgi:hypothetical protein
MFTSGDDVLGGLGVVDAVRGAQGNAHLAYSQQQCTLISKDKCESAQGSMRFLQAHKATCDFFKRT